MHKVDEVLERSVQVGLEWGRGGNREGERERQTK